MLCDSVICVLVWRCGGCTCDVCQGTCVPERGSRPVCCSVCVGWYSNAHIWVKCDCRALLQKVQTHHPSLRHPSLVYATLPTHSNLPPGNPCVHITPPPPPHTHNKQTHPQGSAADWQLPETEAFNVIPTKQFGYAMLRMPL